MNNLTQQRSNNTTGNLPLLLPIFLSRSPNILRCLITLFTNFQYFLKHKIYIISHIYDMFFGMQLNYIIYFTLEMQFFKIALFTCNTYGIKYQGKHVMAQMDCSSTQIQSEQSCIDNAWELQLDSYIYISGCSAFINQSSCNNMCSSCQQDMNVYAFQVRLIDIENNTVLSTTVSISNPFYCTSTIYLPSCYTNGFINSSQNGLGITMHCQGAISTNCVDNIWEGPENFTQIDGISTKMSGCAAFQTLELCQQSCQLPKTCQLFDGFYTFPFTISYWDSTIPSWKGEMSPILNPYVCVKQKSNQFCRSNISFQNKNSIAYVDCVGAASSECVDGWNTWVVPNVQVSGCALYQDQSQCEQSCGGSCSYVIQVQNVTTYFENSSGSIQKVVNQQFYSSFACRKQVSRSQCETQNLQVFQSSSTVANVTIDCSKAMIGGTLCALGTLILNDSLLNQSINACSVFQNITICQSFCASKYCKQIIGNFSFPAKINQYNSQTNEQKQFFSQTIIITDPFVCSCRNETYVQMDNTTGVCTCNDQTNAVMNAMGTCTCKDQEAIFNNDGFCECIDNINAVMLQNGSCICKDQVYVTMQQLSGICLCNDTVNQVMNSNGICSCRDSAHSYFNITTQTCQCYDLVNAFMNAAGACTCKDAQNSHFSQASLCICFDLVNAQMNSLGICNCIDQNNTIINQTSGLCMCKDQIYSKFVSSICLCKDSINSIMNSSGSCNCIDKYHAQVFENGTCYCNDTNASFVNSICQCKDKNAHMNSSNICVCNDANNAKMQANGICSCNDQENTTINEDGLCICKANMFMNMSGGACVLSTFVSKQVKSILSTGFGLFGAAIIICTVAILLLRFLKIRPSYEDKQQQQEIELVEQKAGAKEEGELNLQLPVVQKTRGRKQQ